MSMIFQSYAVWPHMTVTDNVAYGLRMKRVAKNEVRTKVQTLLEATQLQALAGRYPSELSGGQQQRISLARALAPEPEILLLDEPLSNLDANLREEMRFEIRQLHNKFQYTTVYVTHDQTEAMAMADRIVVMNRGHIEQIGTPEDIFEKPSSEFVAQFIGGTNILRGAYRGERCFDAEAFQLDFTGGDAPALGEPMRLSIRFHELELSPFSGEARPNVVPGEIIDQAYMGSYRDYLVDIGVQKLKITAPASLNISPGERVSVRFPPERCRGLVR
jgi:iron(III) transport system ATP-binding protein